MKPIAPTATALVVAGALVAAPFTKHEVESPPGPASIAFFASVSVATSTSFSTTVAFAGADLAHRVPDGTLDRDYKVVRWTAFRSISEVNQG